MSMNHQRRAFLDMIAMCEIGEALLRESDSGYDVLVGATPAKPLLFVGYDRHPNVLNKALNSTAAGRYQILYRYWTHYQKLLGLPDFSPASQDAYALHILKEQQALAPLDEGDLSGAIERCANIWASLPGASYGQPTRSMAYCRRAFEAAGGLETCRRA